MTMMTVSARASKNCLKMPTRFRSSSMGSVLWNSSFSASFGNSAGEYHQISGSDSKDSHGNSAARTCKLQLHSNITQQHHIIFWRNEFQWGLNSSQKENSSKNLGELHISLMRILRNRLNSLGVFCKGAKNKGFLQASMIRVLFSMEVWTNLWRSTNITCARNMLCMKSCNFHRLFAFLNITKSI
jgi:hypothetical protein